MLGLGPKVINFFMLNLLEHEILNSHKNYNADKIRLFLLLNSQILYLSWLYMLKCQQSIKIKRLFMTSEIRKKTTICSGPNDKHQVPTHRKF